MIAPWYKSVKRVVQTNLTEIDARNPNTEFWMEYWKKLNIDTVMVNCSGIVTYYQSELDQQYPSPFMGERDIFNEISEAARSMGLNVIARMDINLREKELIDEKPEWFARQENGDPYEKNGRYVTCVNSDYYKVHVPKVLEEIAKRYSPESFSDNSWQGLSRNEICYCERCKSDFREYAGFALPVAVDWDSIVYRRWIDWSYKCRESNWDLYNRTLKEISGEHCYWIGMINGNPFRNVERFSDIHLLAKKSPIIFSDHQHRSELYGFAENLVSGNLLHSIAGEEVTIIESMAQYYRGDVTFRLSSAPPAEVHNWMLSGIAGGISPWVHHIGANGRDKRQYSISQSVLDWHREHEAFLYGRKNVSPIALLWDNNNILYYGKDDYKNKSELPWAGFVNAMSRFGIPFVPMNLNDFNADDQNIKTVILPDLACVSDLAETAIIDFIRNGGNIVLSGKSSTLDQSGRIKKDMKLWRELGIRLTGATYGNDFKAKGDWTDYSSHNYLLIERHPVFNGFEDTTILPFGGQISIPIVDEYIIGLGGYVANFPIYPPEFSWIRDINDGIHPLYIGKTQYGGNVCYLAADIDRTAARYNINDQYHLLKNIVLWVTNGTLPFRIRVNGDVQSSIYETKDHYIIHLVNQTGSNTDVGNFVNPTTLPKLTLNLQNIRMASVKPTVGDEGSVIVNGNQVEITNFGMHEMLILEKEKHHE